MGPSGTNVPDRANVLTAPRLVCSWRWRYGSFRNEAAMREDAGWWASQFNQLGRVGGPGGVNDE